MVNYSGRVGTTMTEAMDGSGDESTDEFVNYLPGMPRLSREPGRVGRFLVELFRRRRVGAFRVVGRGRNGE